MPLKPGAAIVTLALGLLVAGPLAALALVAVPEAWQGPGIPLAAGVVAVLAVALVRHGGRSKRPRAGGADGGGAAP